MEQDQQKLENRFNSLPQELKDAISSVEIGELVAKIGDEEGLMLDQSADLMDETGLVMLGITPTEQFVSTLIKKLGIDDKKARMISVKINDKIFNKIRTSIQQIQEKNQAENNIKITATPVTPLPKPPSPPPASPPITPLEKVGNFTIEMRSPSTSPLYNDSNLKKENVLNDLENIKNLKPENANAFVEHLLSNPVSNPQQVEVRKQVTPPPNLPTQKKYNADPYREEV